MRKIIFLFWLSLLSCGFSADLVLPALFSDHMILQQGQPVPVWGRAAPGAEVTVQFAGQKQVAVTGEDGRWKTELSPLKTSNIPAELTITAGDQSVVLHDVLIGEVWFCSGQSNMAWTMDRTEDAGNAIAAANFPGIRLFYTPVSYTREPKEAIPSRWSVCTPDTVKSFSGTAYYFGKKLHEDLNVPVGLILSSLGGTSIDPWTPPCGYEGIDSLKDVYEKTQNIPELSTKNKSHRQIPSVLFNGMIYAHIPYAIRGAVWYQGEHDHREWDRYVDKTRALLNGWHKLWGYDFPFYFVQIAPNNYPDNDLPLFWEAQTEIVREIPNTGMAVVSDYATLDNIHPPRKFVPGSRLALLAEAKTYGMDVVCTGPVFQTLEKLDGKLKANFSSADGLTTRDGKDPDWFEIVGKDGIFKPAQALISGNSVILSSPDVKEPVGVRFAWSKLAKPNLMNSAELPAWPFRAGDLPESSAVPLAASPAKPEEKTPAPSTPVPAPKLENLTEMKGFRMIYQLNIPEDASYFSTPRYDVDNSASESKDFSKIAYLLELQKPGEDVQYAFASMDRFTDDLKKIGLPVASSNARFMQKVSALTVRSNVAGIVPCTDSDGGNIEFWPGNYGGKNGNQIPGASDVKHDFGDSTSDKIPGYSCMQVHNWKEKQTVFAINHWGMRGTVDIGIGNAPENSKAPDWTFANNASEFVLRRLTVFVK